MGMIPSRCARVNTETSRRNRVIDKMLDEARVRAVRTIKLLLLGAAGSGKSTLLKQFRIIHMAGFSQEDRSFYKEIIYDNVTQSVRSLLESLEDFDGSQRQDDVVLLINEALHTGDIQLLMPDVVQVIHTLWNDSGVRQFYSTHSKRAVESAPYYLDNIQRIGLAKYEPTDEDILHSRVPTVGASQVQFNLRGFLLQVVDVGGHRSCRRKWVHFFEDVTGVIFVASLSEYDQVLEEDNCTNRLQESLAVFRSICNEKWFRNTSMMLFLNKRDVFTEKLQTSPLRSFLTDFNGVNCFEEAAMHIKSKFLEQNHRQSQREIYVHYTTAVDTRNIKIIFDSTMDTVMKNGLKEIGIF